MCKSTTTRLGAAFVLVVCVTLLEFAEAPCFGRAAGETMAALRNATGGAPPAPERVEACLRLLQEEMASPSTPSFGIGGGPIDSGYLQGVIMGSVCTFAQKGAERKDIRSLVAAKLESTPVSNQAMRDRLTIMLGFTGDETVIPQLITILEKHQEGFMRFDAAAALREMKSCEAAVPALQRIIESDNYAQIRFSDSKREYDSRTMVYSPVRYAAAEVLKRNRISVPENIEVVEAKYGVQRLEPLLYLGGDSSCSTAAIEILGMIGGVEAEKALQTFVNKQAGMAGMKGLVEEAQATLKKLNAVKQAPIR